MRQALFATLVLVVAAPAAPAQGWANKLFPQGTSHDFGTVPRGAQLLHRFAVTNIYAVPLEITQVRVSCTCTTVTPSKKVLQPRESCTLDVSMDGRRFTGVKNITVYVTVGPTYVSTAELRVSANSRTDVVFNPGGVVFGTVGAGQTPTQPVDVEYAGNLDWRVTEVLAQGAPFTVELAELYRRQPRPGTHQVGYRVKVTLKADAPPGTLKRELHLRTNDPASPLISVLVEANVEASLSVLPSPLRLGTMQVGQAVQQRVVVRGRTPFRVLAVDGLGDGLELGAPLSTTPAPVQMLTFRCQPGRAGDFLRSLRIRTDLQTTPIALSVEGSVSP
jgi:hypothetical protein